MSKKINVNVNPTYNPETVIIQRSFGVKDLKKYLEKIKKNIEVFKEAIGKEKTEMKRVEGMIKVLKDDIRQAKQFKLLKKK
ncbi:hypothetical protein HZA76_00275 [Candidatus Roizmanbacteria bacterium]|nr:hypothetical protein [Candidatus Roizmanbacteria bacterium]